jgi:uncharacterized protein YlaI
MAKQQERCVLCQTEVEVEADAHSYERAHYIDTAGQLCPECYSEIAANKEWHNLL